jgi:hypothetical protein
MNVPKPILALFAVLGISLIGLNIALVRQDRWLATLNAAYEGSLHLTVGSSVPSLSGVSLTGEPETVTYEADPPKTVLLVFSSSCPACAVNWPAWRRVMSQIDPKRARLIGVDLGSSDLGDRYLQQVGMTAKTQLILLPDIQSVLSYRFRYTPQTILIGGDSKVEGIWSGPLSQQQIREIERESMNEEVPHVSGDKGTQSR